MSFDKDPEFVSQLERFLNETDVAKILKSSSMPVTDANINKRTGRRCVGLPSTRPRKILKPGSLVNYKSIILQFARYKAEMLGSDAPINEYIADKYDTEKLRNKRNQTSLTNIRVLNKYVFVPTLNMELKKPKAIGPEAYCNKPQLTHSEIIAALRYLWRHCKNRDHVFKTILIYYTGLRSAEALDLTYRDILNAWTDKHIVLSVRRGKNKVMRNIYLFQGAPTHFFRKHLIPYLNFKMFKLISEKNNKTIEELVDSEKIFSESSYQACQKEFRKCLAAAVDNNNNDILKGAGLHSVRSDYSTRCLALVSKYCNNEIFVALKLVSHLMGHTNVKNLLRHYVNLGSIDPMQQDQPQEPEEEEEDDKEENDEEGENGLQNVFQNLERGVTVMNALNNRRKCHSNVKTLINISDNHYIIPISKKHKRPTPLNRLEYV